LLKAKEETLHIVNHQINTPIAVMRGAIDMLKDKIWTEEKVIGIFNEQLTRMKDTIAQFMAAKKAEDGNLFLAKSESDLGTIVKTLVDEKLLLKKVRESGMQIIFSDSNVYKLLLDTPKITEVVSNLLDNAINYSSNNIKLDISQNKKFVTLSVKDSGIGISKENISKLFSRFTRLDNAKKTRPDGTGLGLYVCKQIVEAHGGKIWVESEGEGKGSTFFISLPK
jgi:signal transduction histidine kinase